MLGQVFWALALPSCAPSSPTLSLGLCPPIFPPSPGTGPLAAFPPASPGPRFVAECAWNLSGPPGSQRLLGSFQSPSPGF